MRQPTRSWGSSYVAPPDPDGDKIAAAQRRTWELPVPPVADKATIARYYRSKGVSATRADLAAQADVTDHARTVASRASDAKWAAYDREQRRISTYLAGQKAGRAAFLVELAATRSRARASSRDGTGAGADRALAKAWLALAGSTQMWRGTYIEYDPLARREAVFFAARAGVPWGIVSAWSEAESAGEDAAYWRDQSVLVGDLNAIKSVHDDARKKTGFGFARAAALFEHAHQVMPATLPPGYEARLNGVAPVLCAYFLAEFYAHGDDTLPADPARALAWLRQVPVTPGDGWAEWSYRRAGALENFTGNILSARAVEKELLAEWENLLSGPAAGSARRALYLIYFGRNPAFPTSADPAKARALFPEGPDDANLLIEARDWVACAQYENLPLTQNDSIPVFLGRLWRERTDGKRDLTRARAAFEYALAQPRSRNRGDAALALAEIQLELREHHAAQATLEKAATTLWVDGWQARVRLALGFYRGEFSVLSEKKGDEQMALVSKDLAGLSRQNAAAWGAFIREFEFQRVSAPFLARFNRLESLRQNLKNPTEEHLADIAREHRENLAGSLPALRALALGGYAPATRLWAMLTLSPYATPTHADTGRAKTFLFQSALGGEAPAVVVLAQRLYRDAQEARLAPDATPARLRDQFAEATAWLEAAWKTGDEGALRPLFTIYDENLGGLGSAEKAEEFLRTLAKSGDKEAAAELAEREFAALLPPPPAATLTPAQLQTARAERFALVKKLAETDDPDHPVGRRELARMILRGDQDAAFAEAERALAALVPAGSKATPAAHFTLIEKLAEAGNPAAQREAALMRFRGEGTPKDASEQSGEVLFLLEKSAEAGDFTAALWRAKIQYLGLYHEAGQRDDGTVMQDRFEANDFLHNLAHNGSPLMKYRVGLLYLNDKKREPECFLEAEPAFLDRAHLLLEKARDEGVKAAAEPLAQAAAQLRQQSK